MNDPLQIRTRRLELVPCSLEVAQAATTNKSLLEKLVPVRVPEEWYTTVQNFLPQCW